MSFVAKTANAFSSFFAPLKHQVEVEVLRFWHAEKKWEKEKCRELHHSLVMTKGDGILWFLSYHATFPMIVLPQREIWNLIKKKHERGILKGSET